MRFDAARADRELSKCQPAAGDAAVTDASGMPIAALVGDRARLQLGIGAIPDAVLRRLMERHDLGIHSGTALYSQPAHGFDGVDHSQTPSPRERVNSKRAKPCREP